MTLRTAATVLTVRVNGVIHDDLDVLMIHQGVGGGDNNVAILRARTNRPAAPGWPGEDVRVQNFSFHSAYGGKVAISTPDGKVRHKGAIKHCRITIDAHGGEWVEYTSALEGYLMGGQLDGMEPINQPDGTTTGGDFALQQEVTFNPLVDGKIVFNRAKHKSQRLVDDPDAQDKQEYPCFIDPESVRTGFSRELNNDDEEGLEWTLAEALCYLVGRTNNNVDAPFIRVPTPDEIEPQLGELPPKLENISVPLGIFLPEALDRLLRRFNIGWHIEHVSLDESRLKLWPYLPPDGDDPPVSLRLQAPQQVLDLNLSDTPAMDFSYDTSGLANAAIVLTAPVEIEATWPLIPAWDETYDNLPTGDLLAADPETGEPNPKWKTDQKLANAWRKWVLNEAGDYNGLRSETGYDEAFDLNLRIEQAIEVLGASGARAQQLSIRRRKRFLPTLSRNDQGGAAGLHAGGVTVEWFNAAENKWNLIDTALEDAGGSLSLLADEAGIYLGGIDPPYEIIAQYNPQQNGAAAGRGLWPLQVMRITATLRAERGVRIEIDQTDESVTPWWIETLVDGRLRWPVRAVLKGFGNASIYKDFDALETENDEEFFDGIEAEAAELLKNANVATLHGSATVWGFAWDTYGLGVRIDRVLGREIDLAGQKGGGALPRIMGLTFYPHAQETRVQLSSLRNAYQMPTGRFGQPIRVGRRVKHTAAASVSLGALAGVQPVADRQQAAELAKLGLAASGLSGLTVGPLAGAIVQGAQDEEFYKGSGVTNGSFVQSLRTAELGLQPAGPYDQDAAARRVDRRAREKSSDQDPLQFPHGERGKE